MQSEIFPPPSTVNSTRKFRLWLERRRHISGCWRGFVVVSCHFCLFFCVLVLSGIVPWMSGGFVRRMVFDRWWLFYHDAIQRGLFCFSFRNGALPAVVFSGRQRKYSLKFMCSCVSCPLPLTQFRGGFSVFHLETGHYRQCPSFSLGGKGNIVLNSCVFVIILHRAEGSRIMPLDDLFESTARCATTHLSPCKLTTKEGHRKARNIPQEVRYRQLLANFPFASGADVVITDYIRLTPNNGIVRSTRII